jgi:TRAP-type C4-dicarboxylate transport system substrate-binding protein
LRKIQIGQLHGGTFSPTDFQKRFPDMNIYGLPFVFQSEDEVDYVRKFLDAKLQAGFDELGFVTFGFASGGFAIVMSNEPVRSHADLKGKKVWLPEGDLISYEAMKALQLSPYTAPITDVLTGLQTGLIDIVAIPPVVALALQWHTKVKYVTEVPVLYVMGFMAIQKKAFGRLDAADREIVREVLTRIYEDVNARSRQEALNATEALASVGLEMVEADDGEFEKMRRISIETNRQMAQKGMFSLELLEEMQRHIEDFRSEHGADQDSGAP